jgi:hypothetical protein
MIFIVAITKDRHPRSFRVETRPGYSQCGMAHSRSLKDASGARREAERVFGPLTWEDPALHGVQQEYVISVARCEVKPL